MSYRIVTLGCLPPTRGGAFALKCLRQSFEFKQLLRDLIRQERQQYLEFLFVLNPRLRKLLRTRDRLESRRGWYERLYAILDQRCDQWLQELGKDPRAKAHQAKLRRITVKAVGQAQRRTGLHAYTADILEWQLLQPSTKLVPRPQRHFNGTGIFVQRFQKPPLTVSALTSGHHPRVFLFPVPNVAWFPDSRASQRRLQRTELHVRFQTQDKQSQWVTFPCIWHRRFPPGLITQLTVVRFHTPGGFRWVAKFAVSLKTEILPRARQGRVRVTPHYVVVDGKQAVARWEGLDGAAGLIYLPAKVQRAQQRLLDLQARWAREYSQVHGNLIAWTAERLVPDWLSRCRVSTVPTQRSYRSLRHLIVTWRQQRLAGDAEIFSQLSSWSRWMTQQFARRQLLQQKLQQRQWRYFQVQACALAQQYRECELVAGYGPAVPGYVTLQLALRESGIIVCK